MPNRKLSRQDRNGENKNEAIEILVKRAVKGDRTALYELCEKIARNVFCHAMYLVGNSADAEDISQETLLQVCEKIGTLRDPKAFRGWLGRITTNEANKLFKKNVRHGVVLNIDDYLESILEENKDFLPQEYAEKEEYRKVIADVIGTLPQRQRQAVLLYYYSGLNVTEVAREMGISPAGISEYLAHAREKLKKEIAKTDFDMGEVRFGSVAVPTGIVLTSVLKGEFETGAINPEIVHRLLSACDAFIKSGATVASASTATVTSAVTATVSKSMLLPLIGAVSAFVATAGIVVGVQLSHSTPPGQTSTAGTSGSIVFSGGMDVGEGYAYMNPTRVQSYSESKSGEVEILEWWITEFGSETVLFSGKGDDVGDVLATLPEACGDGGYMFYFRLKDKTGAVWKLGKNFMLSQEAD